MILGEKVLVVDDEPMVLSLVSTILAGAGYDVTTAHSGKEALRLIEATDFELIVSDVRMPEVSGSDLAKRMRFTNAPRLLFMSGSSSEPVRDLLGHGAAGFLKKPFRSTELLKAVQAALGRATRAFG
jgi:DNA-binding response OmpR family regulator